jgi:O-antigen ligase
MKMTAVFARESRVARSWPAALAILALGILCGAITAWGQPWLGFAALAGVGFVAVVARWPQAGVLGAVAVLYVLPFGVIPAPLGGVKLTFLDATLTLVLAVWLLRAIGPNGNGVRLTSAGPAVLALLGVMVTALLLSQDTVSAETFRFFLKSVNSVLLYFTVVNLFPTVARLRLLVRAVMAAAGACAALAVGLYLLPAAIATQVLLALSRVGYPSGDKLLRYIADTDTLRATGSAVDPNVLGGMLAIALPLLAAQAAEPQPLLRRRWVMALLAVAVAALALTYSRGAWFGAASGLLFLGAVRYRRLAMAGGAGAALLALAPVGQQFFARFFSGVTFADRAAQMRLGEYKDALRLIGEYPLFGVGFGAAPSLDLYVGSSSIYLMMASQMGLVGVAAFLASMALVFTSAFRDAPGDAAASGLRLGLAASLLAALSAGLFDHYFFNLQFPHTIALLWLFAGMLAASAGDTQQRQRVTSGE